MPKYSITAVIGVVTDKLSKGLKTAEGKVKGLGKAFTKGMGHPAVQAAVQVGKAVVAFGVDAVKTAGKIDASMNEVFTLLPGMAEGAKKKMTKEMLDLSSKMGKMPADMVGSLYNALSAGIPKENVFNFLETASKAAIGGVATTEQAVGALTTVLNGYKMPASEAANVSDTLFTIIKNGVTTMPELAANIGKVTPMAASLGIKFEEVGAAFAEMTKNLGPGKSAETGTMLKAMLAELAKGGSKAADAFFRISGKSFPEFVKEGGTMQEALQLMSKEADSTGVRITDFFGSIEAGQAALILAQDNAKGLGDQMVEMGKKKGAASEAFKTVDQGFSRMMEKLMAGFEQFKHTVGTALKPVVDVVLPLFLKGLKMIQNLPWNKLGKVVGEMAKQMEPIVEVFFELVDALFPMILNSMKQSSGTLKLIGPLLQMLLKLLVLMAPALIAITLPLRAIGWLLGKIGDGAGWVGKKLGLMEEAQDKVNDSVERGLKLSDKVEKRRADAIAKQKAKVEAEKAASKKLGVDHEIVKRAARKIRDSKVDVKTLQDTIGVHKDVKSLADIYRLIGSGLKTPQQLIEEAMKEKGHQKDIDDTVWITDPVVDLTPGERLRKRKEEAKKIKEEAEKQKEEAERGTTPAEQVKDATKETKKLNEEAEKNPFVNLGEGGVEVKATVTLDRNSQKLLFQRLAGIHHDTSAISHQLKGKFTNQ